MSELSELSRGNNGAGMANAGNSGGAQAAKRRPKNEVGGFSANGAVTGQSGGGRRRNNNNNRGGGGFNNGQVQQHQSQRPGNNIGQFNNKRERRGGNGNNRRPDIVHETEHRKGDRTNNGRNNHHRAMNHHHHDSQFRHFNSRKQYQPRRPPKLSKGQFLKANCQFVVKASGDYAKQLTDPDVVVEWETIEQITFNSCSGQPTSCPICLNPPSVAKITRCGHVYCWPCILHYFALSDDKLRNCPICFETICKDDLKSVVVSHKSEHVTGKEIEMKLMRRERNSVFAVPAREYDPEIHGKHPSLSQKNNTYSKLVVASPVEILNEIILREKMQLEDLYKEQRNDPEVVFVEEALQSLDKRIREGCKSEDHPPPKNENANIFNGAKPKGSVSRIDSAPTLEVEAANNSNNKSSSGNNAAKETFYFYQSSDGQPIFMHALNVQMLIKEFGSLEQCPDVIKGRIVEKDQAFVTEDHRYRLRYLRHLPIASYFEVCELNISDPELSKETVDAFAEQVNQRQRRRARCEREEKRREKRIQSEEEKYISEYYYTFGAKRIESSFNSSDFFVEDLDFEINMDEMPALGGTALPEGETFINSGGNSGVTTPTTSFSSILRTKKATPQQHPPKSQSVEDSLMMMAFPVLPTRQRQISVRSIYDEEDEIEVKNVEGYVPPPPQATLGDALADALNKAIKLSPDDVKVEGDIKDKPQASGKKKGKKNKGIKINLTGGAGGPRI